MSRQAEAVQAKARTTRMAKSNCEQSRSFRICLNFRPSTVLQRLCFRSMALKRAFVSNWLCREHRTIQISDVAIPGGAAGRHVAPSAGRAHAGLASPTGKVARLPRGETFARAGPLLPASETAGVRCSRQETGMQPHGSGQAFQSISGSINFNILKLILHNFVFYIDRKRRSHHNF